MSFWNDHLKTSDYYSKREADEEEENNNIRLENIEEYMQLKPKDTILSLEQDIIFGSRPKTLRVVKRLNCGGFGSVYRGVLTHQSGEKENVILKIEHALVEHPQLQIEHTFYRRIYCCRDQLINGIPVFHRFLVNQTLEYTPRTNDERYPNVATFGKFNILVLEELGLNLCQVRKKFAQGLPFACWIDLAAQIFKIMKYLFQERLKHTEKRPFFLHLKSLDEQKRVIHRDIKPGNFVLGNQKETIKSRGPDKVFLVDFGLSKTFEQWKNDRMVYMKRVEENTLHIGTKTYMSENVMAGDRPHMRDDLISCCYVLREMLDGCLPWDEEMEAVENNREWVRFRII
jgi:serine/threonine protein kinase